MRPATQGDTFVLFVPFVVPALLGPLRLCGETCADFTNSVKKWYHEELKYNKVSYVH
jgi:hypothetical protein